MRLIIIAEPPRGLSDSRHVFELFGVTLRRGPERISQFHFITVARIQFLFDLNQIRNRRGQTKRL